MGKIIANGIEFGGTVGGVTDAKDLNYDNSVSKLVSTNVQDAIDELKKSVADGKSLLATTISDNGVTTASDATFAEINTNINTLITNKYNAGKTEGKAEGIAETKVGTAEAGDVLVGKTFTNSSDVGITGALPNLTENATIDYTSSDTTPVIEGDQITISDNNDGVKRVSIRYAGVKGVVETNTEFGIAASKLGTATPSEVVSGYSFSSETHMCSDGTMPNNGAWTKQLTNDDLWYYMERTPNLDLVVTIPKGYHSGSGKVYFNSTDLEKVKNAYYNNGYSAGVTAGGAGKYIVKTGTTTFTGTNGAHTSEPAIATGLSKVVGFSMYGKGADLEAGGDNNQIAALVSWYSSGGTVYPSWRDNHSSNLTFTLHWVAWGS